MNHHPDGWQMFFPQQNKPFVAPLTLPGDNLQPEQIVAFWCDGSKGLCVHPNIWHEGISPTITNSPFATVKARFTAMLVVT